MSEKTTPEVRIDASQIEGGGVWECDVEIEGIWVGGGTAGNVNGALDVAMDILYGDTNDWLNGDHGALSRLKGAA